MLTSNSPLQELDMVVYFCNPTTQSGLQSFRPGSLPQSVNQVKQLLSSLKLPRKLIRKERHGVTGQGHTTLEAEAGKQVSMSSRLPWSIQSSTRSLVSKNIKGGGWGVCWLLNPSSTTISRSTDNRVQGKPGQLRTVSKARGLSMYLSQLKHMLGMQRTWVQSPAPQVRKVLKVYMQTSWK